MAQRITAEQGIELLLSVGLRVKVTGSADLLVDDSPVQVKVSQKAPSPSDVTRTLDGWRQRARPKSKGPNSKLMLVLSRIPQSLQKLACGNADLAIAGVHEKILIWEGQRRAVGSLSTEAKDSELAAVRPNTEKRQRGRIPWGRHALMRTLMFTNEPRSQARLASEAGLTQAGVSKALKDWPNLVTRVRGGWRATAPDDLWRQFMASYPGPGGITEYWYRDDSVVKQAHDAARPRPGDDRRAGEGRVLISGDVAADEFAPWRIARKAIVYASAGRPLDRVGFAETSRDEATLELVVPADPTICSTADTWATLARLGEDRALVDPVLAAWDVLRTGGPDADQAVEKLRLRIMSATIS